MLRGVLLTLSIAVVSLIWAPPLPALLIGAVPGGTSFGLTLFERRSLRLERRRPWRSLLLSLALFVGLSAQAIYLGAVVHNHGDLAAAQLATQHALRRIQSDWGPPLGLLYLAVVPLAAVGEARIGAERGREGEALKSIFILQLPLGLLSCGFGSVGGLLFALWLLGIYQLAKDLDAALLRGAASGQAQELGDLLRDGLITRLEVRILAFCGDPGARALLGLRAETPSLAPWFSNLVTVGDATAHRVGLAGLARALTALIANPVALDVARGLEQWSDSGDPLRLADAQIALATLRSSADTDEAVEALTRVVEAVAAEREARQGAVNANPSLLRGEALRAASALFPGGEEALREEMSDGVRTLILARVSSRRAQRPSPEEEGGGGARTRPGP